MNKAAIFEELNELDKVKESLEFVAFSFTSEQTYTTGAYFTLQFLLQNIEKIEKNITNLLKN